MVGDFNYRTSLIAPNCLNGEGRLPQNLSSNLESPERRPNVGLILGHRLRRWTNIKPTLGKQFVLTLVFLSD